MKIKFDHTKNTFYESMGLSREDFKYINVVALFEIISSWEKSRVLYDNRDEAPSDLTTKSAVLERALGKVSEKQAPFLLLIFLRHTTSITGMLDHFQNCKECKKDPLRMLSETIKMAPILKLVKVLQDSKHNFDKFLEKIEPSINSDGEGLDKLISNTLSEDFHDEEED